LTYIPTYTELDTELAFELTAIGPGVAIDEDNPAMAEFASLLRASQYQDFVVNNEEGDNIGNADDLLIDINQAQVIYSIVDVGGFLGINENEIAVPWSMFTWDPEQDMFILPVEQTVLEAAPVFDDDEWAEGPPAAGWDDEYATYWDDLDTE
ncbi:MAG: PRC-barrel domain-containing protein, partial [Anaerolineae bacterium]